MLQEFQASILVRRLVTAFGGTALAMSTAPAALAQDASSPQVLERVEITGSAIKRIDAETAVPVTILKVDQLREEGVTSVEQLVDRITASTTIYTTSQVVGLNTGGASFADLRGLGTNKTLVLLNGRRLANNALDGSAPDLNMIPFAALDRVEILRDGASALYGTDAIGGVINFITKRDYTGGEVTLGADVPQSSGGKGANFNIAAGFGNLDEDRFNVMGVFDYQATERITSQQRGFGARGYLPEHGLDRTSSVSYPSNYYQIDASGTPVSDSANPGCIAPHSFSLDGGVTCVYDPNYYQDLTPKTETASLFGKAAFKINAEHTAKLEYFLTRNTVETRIGPAFGGGVMLDSSSPYYPGNGITPLPGNFTLDPSLPVSANWRTEEAGPRQDKNVNTGQRLVAGFEGVIGGWDYDTAFSYNENKFEQKLTGGYLSDGLIADGVANGILNPFGPQDAAGLAYLNDAAVRGLLQTAKGQVYSVDGKLSRELGDWFGAGRAASLAVGAEFRHEKYSDDINADVAALVASSTGVDPDSSERGDRDVTALYTELNLPITRKLELGFAVRHDRYSDFGNTTNPKVSFRYEATPTFLTRGSYSTGFRAPSLYELYQPSFLTYTYGQYDDPVLCPGGVPAAGGIATRDCAQQFLAQAGGNRNLEPEKSKNVTLGFVIEPTRDFNVGLDFWWIRLKNSIGNFPENVVFADPTTYASRIVRGADGTLDPFATDPGYIVTNLDNLGGVITRGIDLSANYRMQLPVGRLSLSFNGTYVDSYKYQRERDGDWVQKAGHFVDEGAIFHWKHAITAALSDGPWSVGVTNRFQSGYSDENFVDPEYQGDVASYSLWDVFGAWSFTKALTLTAGVKNVFDKDPPFSNQSQTFQIGYDPRYTDPTGRLFYARLNYKFK